MLLLTAIAWTWLAAALSSAAYLLWDELARGRHMMAVMKWVWPITALYLGPFAILAYRKFQLEPMRQAMEMKGEGGMMHKMGQAKPLWVQAFTGVTHCGAGCTLGDIAAEWTVFGLGLTVAGSSLWPELAGDYALAYLLGIAFQYFSIAPMRGISGWPGIWAAVKADTLSLTAFEVGLFAWMLFFSLVLFHQHLHPDSPVYWFMMQIGMALGFLTSFPVNAWLIRKGIKEPM